MTFYFYLLIGFTGGMLGGMGMGGGTLLIPLLTLLMGVEQHTAQLCNLLCFLPMATFALPVHFRNGLIDKDGLFSLIFSSSVTAIACSLLSSLLPAVLLRKALGVFLFGLGISRSLAFIQVFQSRPIYNTKGK